MTWRELVKYHCGEGMSGFINAFVRCALRFEQNGQIKRGSHKNSEVIAWNRTPDQMHAIILNLT